MAKIKPSHLRIYVAGPYTAKSSRQRLANVNSAINAGIILFEKGHYPFIPHLTHFVDVHPRARRINLKWEDYIRWDMPWLVSCDALLYLKSSKGADLELKIAKRLGKIVFDSITDVPTVKRAKAKLSNELLFEIATDWRTNRSNS